MRAPLDWNEEGRLWPHADRSRLVEAGGLRWHVQEWGGGEAGAGRAGAPDDPGVVLLLHGSGGSSHSWAGVAPLLADAGFGVVVPDLPGHAFTERPPDAEIDLDGFTAAVGALVAELGRPVRAVVGHSAGAAVALELARKLKPTPAVVGVCPSLVRGENGHRRFQGVLGGAFRTKFAARFAAGLVRHTSGLGSVLESTGSRVPEASRTLYRLLSAEPEHVHTTLTLFGNWDAKLVELRLRTARGPVLLLAGGEDGWIPFEDVEKAAAALPDARLEVLNGLGHVAHEEAPELVASLILGFIREAEDGQGV